MPFRRCLLHLPALLSAAILLAAIGWVIDLACAAEKATGSSSVPADKQEAFSHGVWPFCPLAKPPVPAVEHHDWIHNPVDAFVMAAFEKHGLRPSAPADKLTLLRRVTFDLTGLPPTIAEQEAFLQDQSSNAFERVVDRLLQSPRYGERYAQHWLDLVRFAESDGFNQDAVREQAYRYRDYVIRALNDDLPYDRFIAQQLAGDELEPHNPDALVATGLNRLYPDEWNAGDLRLRRQEILDDVTDTTGLVFLGLTMGCAQCHDHKFDEILQEDYFRLQAFFAPMLARDDLPIATLDEQRRHQEQTAAWEQQTQSIRNEIAKLIEPKRRSILESTIKKYDDEIRTAILTPDEERTAYQKHLNRQASLYYAPKLDTAASSLKGADKERYDSLVAELAKFDRLKPAPLPRGMVIQDASSVAPATFTLATGNVRKPIAEVTPGFPQFLGKDAPQIDSPPNLETTGRRSALVRWLTQADHPLTTRVMVNRVWQYHFGDGIVASGNDFGSMGSPPTHPELLDWLSVYFVEHGWSFKQLHRLLLTSNAYQQANLVGSNVAELHASQEKPNGEVDPGNKFLWHARRKRLEGEAIRDAMLFVSGELNTQYFGPSARFDIPAGVSNQAWKPDTGPGAQQRRSIYGLAKRNFRFPMFDAFDAPDMHHSCAKRPSTTTAPQALVQLNSQFSLERARHWTDVLLREHDADEVALVAAAYRGALGRVATADEIAAARGFIAAVKRNLGSSSPAESQRTAIVEFCHALFNCNEFLYVD